MDDVSELDRALERVEAFFDRLPLPSYDRTGLPPASSEGIDAIARACGRPLPTQLVHLLRRGLRLGVVTVRAEDTFDDETVHAAGFAKDHDDGFGGFDAVLSADEIVDAIALDRREVARGASSALLESVRVFQVRPHYRVRLLDGAVLFETDDGPRQLAPSLAAFFDAWLEVGCFTSHDYRTYARGLSSLIGWTPPAPSTAVLLRTHDEIYRTTFFQRDPLRGASSMSRAQRIELWVQLAEHFLDTDTRHWIPISALRCIEAGLTVAEAHDIWCYEVTPAVWHNLDDVAGDWAMWPKDWLVGQIDSARKDWESQPGPESYSVYRRRIGGKHRDWVAIERCMVLIAAEAPARRAALARELHWLTCRFFDSPSLPLESREPRALRALFVDSLLPILEPLIWTGPHGDPPLDVCRVRVERAIADLG